MDPPTPELGLGVTLAVSGLDLGGHKVLGRCERLRSGAERSGQEPRNLEPYLISLWGGVQDVCKCNDGMTSKVQGHFESGIWLKYRFRNDDVIMTSWHRVAPVLPQPCANLVPEVMTS